MVKSRSARMLASWFESRPPLQTRKKKCIYILLVVAGKTILCMDQPTVVTIVKLLFVARILILIGLF